MNSPGPFILSAGFGRRNRWFWHESAILILLFFAQDFPIIAGNLNSPATTERR